MCLHRRACAAIARLLLGLAFGFVAASGGAVDFSFRTDVLPILTKAGCNAGACHGASTGQGGFRLSLLGYDPEEDFWTITREFGGRRIATDAPEESLFLRKPTHQIDHEGGRRIKRGSDEYRALLQWIERGAPFGAEGLSVARIAVDPPDHLFEEAGGEIQLRVTAYLSNGESRDATKLALYTSNDDGTAAVDKSGLVTMRNRGLTSIMIRYGGQVAAARVALPFGDSEAQTNDFAPRNFIDDEILAELRRLRISPAPLSENAEFLRRASLDLTGRLPAPEWSRQFIEMKDSEAARGKVLDELIGSEGFVDYWTLKLADMLLIGGKRGSEEATKVYHDWVREQVSRNAPWDAVARELLTGTGDIGQAGPPNFYALATDPRDMAEHAGRMFLGIQIGCARCHAHPSDRWTQDDYYDFSAFFARVARNGNTVETKDAGELEYPKSHKPARPKPLGRPRTDNAKSGDRLEMAAAAVTTDSLFAKAMANRVWKELFGRGLVEPADDLRPTNPATHPALLEKLGAEFAGHGYDLRWLIRTIATSRTYQLSSCGGSATPGAERLFARSSWRPLPAQVLMDAISQVTGVAERFENAVPGTRAVQLIGAQTPSYGLDVLGRCKRERSCESSGGGGGLAQALHLINGATVNQKLEGGRLAELIREGRSNREIVEDFYVRALGRRPDREESRYWRETLGGIADRREALQDFLWTLSNSREFGYNH